MPDVADTPPSPFEGVWQEAQWLRLEAWDASADLAGAWVGVVLDAVRSDHGARADDRGRGRWAPAQSLSQAAPTETELREWARAQLGDSSAARIVAVVVASGDRRARPLARFELSTGMDAPHEWPSTAPPAPAFAQPPPPPVAPAPPAPPSIPGWVGQVSEMVFRGYNTLRTDIKGDNAAFLSIMAQQMNVGLLAEQNRSRESIASMAQHHEATHKAQSELVRATLAMGARQPDLAAAIAPLQSQIAELREDLDAEPEPQQLTAEQLSSLQAGEPPAWAQLAQAAPQVIRALQQLGVIKAPEGAALGLEEAAE